MRISDLALSNQASRRLRNALLGASLRYDLSHPAAPVLSLDRMWINDHVEASTCGHLWTIRSDHRPVLAELGLP